MVVLLFVQVSASSSSPNQAELTNELPGGLYARPLTLVMTGASGALAKREQESLSKPLFRLG